MIMKNDNDNDDENYNENENDNDNVNDIKQYNNWGSQDSLLLLFF